jgi:hypothetical protein
MGVANTITVNVIAAAHSAAFFHHFATRLSVGMPPKVGRPFG